MAYCLTNILYRLSILESFRYILAMGAWDMMSELSAAEDPNKIFVDKALLQQCQLCCVESLTRTILPVDYQIRGFVQRFVFPVSLIPNDIERVLLVGSVSSKRIYYLFPACAICSECPVHTVNRRRPFEMTGQKHIDYHFLLSLTKYTSGGVQCKHGARMMPSRARIS